MLVAMRRSGALTQAQLARRSGIPRTAINAYERGRRTPTATTLFRLAEGCGMALTASPTPELDLRANAAALEQALDLAELLPQRRRDDRLAFPSLVGR